MLRPGNFHTMHPAQEACTPHSGLTGKTTQEAEGQSPNKPQHTGGLVWITASTVNRRASALCQIAGMHEYFCIGLLSDECSSEAQKPLTGVVQTTVSTPNQKAPVLCSIAGMHKSLLHRSVRISMYAALFL
jgi:hypothetical protein